MTRQLRLPRCRALLGRRPPAFRMQSAQGGQAVVEMAGALTMLLVLVIGIVDFTPAVVRGAQLTQAVRDGAAYARTAPTSTFEIRKRVVRSTPSVYPGWTDAQIAAMTNADIAVTCATGLAGAAKACSSAVVGDSVTVTATFNYPTVTGLFSALLDGPIEITRSATSEIL
jgi:Flp pilus assembly protein TadG